MFPSVSLRILKTKKTKRVLQSKNTIKKSAIAQHLVNNPSCGKKFTLSNFSVMRQCSNTLELIRFEAILIHLNKPNLCQKKEFDYTLAQGSANYGPRAKCGPRARYFFNGMRPAKENFAPRDHVNMAR